MIKKKDKTIKRIMTKDGTKETKIVSHVKKISKQKQEEETHFRTGKPFSTIMVPKLK